MEPLALFGLALLLYLLYLLRPKPPARCPRCGLPRALAEEVRRHRRFCPHLAFRACPFDPRKGVYRLRR
ncbi:MAG: hypothetical protein NZ846_10015 [Thermus sp.]|uniref:hypothetical protein n=1 Tax=unclassified Thermus TaxID=2619321 RepID=UPI000238A3D0|nr:MULTISPECIES: hypothetical protein [unclassified Thermus]AEV15747.1 hypothetical protein TCCBUS3UF1_6990 [Thermus sp. CCB_US3_UF1]MCS6869672.1 hypothetical protein [Thermus sp.]MCS7219286.1 hypothetical protein [Thermus sp.]MDW8017020.1 hypothetical protein [Thermus sp.]MDW8358057.1 hypothetical protein [Thermus sp.]